MATYYVAVTGNDSTGNGSTGNPWKTLSKANQQISASDTVRVRAGTYEEQLSITKANTTWRADNPAAKPVVNGRWHIGLMSGGNTLTKNSTMPKIDSGSYLPPGTNSKQGLIQITASGVTLDGFVSQNSTGSGISIGASNVTVQNCVTYFTYSSGILCNPSSRVSNVTIKNNIIRFASIKIFDPVRFTEYAGPCKSQCVDGSLKVGTQGTGTLIQGNDIGFGFGEGINIGKGNVATAANPIVVENNTIHDINHTYIYINDSKYVVVRGNLLYCTGVELNMWDGDPPAGIRIKDEQTVGGAQNVTIYNNVVVNLGIGYHWGERYTAARGVYFGYNTIVGGPETEIKNKFGVMVIKQQVDQNGGTSNLSDQQGIVENNIIDHTAISIAVLKVNNATGNAGVTLRNNNWSKQPNPSGTADMVGNPKLVNAGAVLTTTNYPTKANTTWASVTTSDNFNINNYKLTASSPGRGGASSGATASGVTPPDVATDYLGSSRDATKADRDVGALEYGGVVPNSVTADFSDTPRSGAATLAVAFSDLSTASGAAVINSWAWDFGDGGTATSKNPSHNYTVAGTYTVALTIQATALSLSDTATKVGYITVGGSPPAPAVTANFSGTPRSGAAPLSVVFTNLSTASGSAVINSYAWTFGDGGTSTSQNPSHTYSAAGTYTVTLTVQDTVLSLSDGETKTGYIVVAVANDVHANFTFTPASGEAPLTVNFTDASTDDGAAVVNSWSWTFGDGGTSTSQNPSHSYATAGVYSITLTASDTSLGISDVITKGTVTVTSPPDPTVTANFTTNDARTGLVPLTVRFSDLSGGPVANWLWDFGDGETSTSANPSHTYRRGGVYTVSLTVDNGSGTADAYTAVEYIAATVPTVREIIVGPFPTRDVQTGVGYSVTHWDGGDNADPSVAGLIELATDRPHLGLVLSIEGTTDTGTISATSIGTLIITWSDGTVWDVEVTAP